MNIVKRPISRTIIGFGAVYAAPDGTGEAADPPVVFPKFANAVVGDQGTVELAGDDLDLYGEPELAVVIGKTVPRYTTAEAALSYVGGYTVANDFTGRGHMSVDPQWLRGKTADGYLPIGDQMVTDLDVSQPIALKMWIDGELVVDGSTERLLFPVAKQIEFLSSFMTLHEGDVILTGAPGAAGPLQAGQEVIAELGGQLRVTTHITGR
ncbi:fumarylacetoacetate hydrolase family protein [Stomatohabitans albus]|uniref:fumarylacetoacetate hydrolase family protein n=1 Tax=Stomatohabitans albus TaxID=3110766 RepID=UPI00300C5639